MEIPSEFRRNSSVGSGNSENFTQEMAESFQFREEIQSLMAETDLPQQSLDSPGENGSSFTALLGLSTNRAMELHVPESGNCPVLPSPEIWTDRVVDGKQPLEPFSFSCLPTFPSNAALVKRAERFSVFAEESPQTSSDPSNSTENSLKLKIEPLDSDSYRNSSPIFAPPTAPIERHRSGKRKEGEKSKVRAPAKKSKNVEKGSTKTGGESEGCEKLPYVHVRARRGQATDSHSLAERARREKINARMKLLQGLVPGCNKISGTALVLDEIINHVQSLQRQVEILSMRLAAVNPRIDSSSLELFFSSDNASMTASSVGTMVTINPLQWPEVQGNGTRQQQQLWHGDSWQRDERDVFVNTTPEISLQGYDSGNSGSQRSSQLKMEL